MPMNLTMPKKAASKGKLAAYKRHWNAIANIQGELNSQWIHLNRRDGEVAEKAQLSLGTVQRFRQWGRGQGRMFYSYFHGPTATTIVGIAAALDLELVVRKRNGAR